MIYKLYWSSWHRNLGKLAMDVLGPEAELIESGPYELNKLQSLFSVYPSGYDLRWYQSDPA